MQLSPVEQALPSLHVLVLSGVKTQPVEAMHVSSVHALLSLQLKVPEPTHDPLLLQVSVVVHKLPSVQVTPLSDAEPACWQAPVETLQLSAVQGLLSLQTVALPTHEPLTQVSLLVHALPSLQLPVLLVKTQPEPAEQVSVVHALLSLQLRLPEPTHKPLLLQVSVVVHRLLSLHAAPDRLKEPALLQAPVEVLQVSNVHGLVSAQLLRLVKVQLPPTHLSSSVQALPSVQVLVSSFWY